MSLLTSKTLRLGLTLTLASGVILMMSGCTDEEVADSAVIIAAAAIVSGNHADDRGPRYDHDRGLGDRHDDHGGDRGRDRGPGPGDRGPGGRPHAFEVKAASAALDAKIASLSVTSSVASAATVAAPAFVSTDARVIQLAAKYDISHYAATYLVRAIVLAQSKDTSGITDLGLSVADFKDLYEGDALAESKIETLGAKLLMDNAATARLVQEMTADVQAEKAARGL